MSNIFLTAATGYIGGSVLDTLVKCHSEYHITVLLRTVPEGFTERYPNVNIVIGSFNDVDLIANTAAQNNIVIHGGKTKHVGSLNAHIEGLLRRPGPSFLIRLGGTGLIADWQDGSNYGEMNPKVWSDINDIDEITSLPDDYLHRNMDKIVQAAAHRHGDKLKCAIICPPGIYGPGRGMVRKQSLFIPEMGREILKLGSPYYTQSGENRRAWVHIDDLMELYNAIVEAAVAGGGNAVWGREGYYFAATQEATQKEMARFAGKILKSHGLIKTEEPVQLSLETITEMRDGSDWHYMGLYTWGSNTRCTADRAKKYLGYESKAPTLWETMEGDLLFEVERLARVKSGE
ncbi:hypothetical protein HYALB_00011666 [Hymenoscyphus albidus]|uniref:NAD-dependent epimerase/dehydratase domain-containing protein n=1 Tax=Hymenoscyphus albidus TaxID=595503 RepID=A0A9N9LUI9_9HELO|nr:hypothetical protein HYALB_00011666 [Hymenoscyphus albidus]